MITATAREIVQSEGGPETTFVSWDKPLPPAVEATIVSLRKRYVDQDGQPLVLFDSDPDKADQGWVALHIPRVIRPTFFATASQQ